MRTDKTRQRIARAWIAFSGLFLLLVSAWEILYTGARNIPLIIMMSLFGLVGVGLIWRAVFGVNPKAEKERIDS
jgi:hypothetical protein